MQIFCCSVLRVLLLGLVACGTTVIETPAAVADTKDRSLNDLLSEVLQSAVRPDGVDYAVLKRNIGALSGVQAKLAAATVPTDKNERMAFYINAYNALTLALTVELLPKEETKWPSWSLRDQGSTVQNVWKKYKFTVAGKELSLDEIEHKLLRPMGDPRIHFAINCASKSCPALSAKPYAGATIESDLQQATAVFMKDPSQVRVVGDTIKTNPILDWFGDDFKVRGGVKAFLIANLPGGAAKDALVAGKSLGFFDYDWHLNLANKSR